MTVVVAEYRAEMTDAADHMGRMRSAARFCLYSSPTGKFRGDEPSLGKLGLFGLPTARITYGDAVKAGAAGKVDVYWLQVPRPQNVESTSVRKLVIESIEKDPAACQMVADIVNATPDSLGCLCFASKSAMARIGALLPGVAQLPNDRGIKGIGELRKDISSGKIRKALLERGAVGSAPHSVMIAAGDAGEAILDFV